MKVFSPHKLDELLRDPRVRPTGVALVAGISYEALSSIRKGKRKPRANTLAALAEALNKPMDYFLEEEAIVNQQQLALETKSAS